MGTNSYYFKCIRLNQQHCSTAPSSLAQLILGLNIDVIILQEPYTIFQGNSIFCPNIPNGCIARHCLDQNAAYGAAILIRKSIPSQVITHHSSNNIIGSEIKLGLQSYRLYSVYCRSPTVTISDTLDNTMND